MVVVMQKREAFDHVSGASEKFFQIQVLYNVRKRPFCKYDEQYVHHSSGTPLAFEPHTFNRIDNGTRVKNDDFDICCTILAYQ